MNSVVVTDTGEAKFLDYIGTIHRLKGSYVDVGFPLFGKIRRGRDTKSGRPPCTTMSQIASVAIIQEKGSASRNIPARPFFVPALQKNKREIANAMQEATELLVSKLATKNEALGDVGSKVAGFIKYEIDTLVSPVLSNRTVEKKGHAKPLIDRGQMRNSVTYVVGKGDAFGQL